MNTTDSSCMQLLSDGICHSDFLILCDSLLTPSPGGICGPSPGPSPDSRWYHPEALGPTRPHPARQKKIWEHSAQASDFVGKKNIFNCWSPGLEELGLRPERMPQPNASEMPGMEFHPIFGRESFRKLLGLCGTCKRAAAKRPGKVKFQDIVS